MCKKLIYLVCFVLVLKSSYTLRMLRICPVHNRVGRLEYGL
ncbi:MAG TPA: hypothetical protein VMW72_01410 [Sedimentisphaerales bacterium]|nr:hypothetical protein [Sedimentisphaerales bacterium]